MSVFLSFIFFTVVEKACILVEFEETSSNPTQCLGLLSGFEVSFLILGLILD